MTRREFTIGPEFNLPKVIAEAEKLAARAVTKGLSGGYTVTTKQQIRPGINGGQPQSVTVVIIAGEPVKYNGWAFVAKVEYVNGSPVVTGSPWYEGPQVDRSTLRPNACDHCGISIARKKTIVVEDEAGQRKQVGTSCVKDFLGAEVTGAWYSEKDPFDALESYAGSGGVPMENLLSTLAQAACVIRQSGWIPGWKSETDQTTAQTVRLLKGWGSAKYAAETRAQYGDPTDADKAVAERAIAWGQSMEGDSDYAANVRAVFAGGDWIDPKFIGLAVSVPAMMLKAEGRAADAAKAAETPITDTLYAPEGARVEVTDAEVTEVYGFATQWGFTRIVYLIGDGHRFKWMTSTDPGLSIGEKVSFKATVKGLDEYDGKVSTQVLRVKAVAA